MKSDVFRGIEALNELKKATDTSKRSMVRVIFHLDSKENLSQVEDVPILLQSRNRRVIKFVPRIVSDSKSFFSDIYE